MYHSVTENELKQLEVSARKFQRQQRAAHRRKIVSRQRRLLVILLCGLLLAVAALVGSRLGITVAEASTTAFGPVGPMVAPLSNVVATSGYTQPELAVTDIQSFAAPTISTDFKAFMDYRSITDRTSTQWEMQQVATTDSEGFRIWNSYYMVAMGTYYAPYCGRIFSITLSSGRVFQCVVADIKDDRHTDEKNQHRNGNVIEFIVDGGKIPEICWEMGDMSWAPDAAFRGDVETIELISSPY